MSVSKDIMVYNRLEKCSAENWNTFKFQPLTKLSSSSSVVLLGRRSFAENRIASLGVLVAGRESSWATKAICFLTSTSVGSTLKSSRRTSDETERFPLVLVRPARTLSRLLFPAPDGPMMAVICFFGTSPQMFLRRTLPPFFFVPYFFPMVMMVTKRMTHYTLLYVVYGIELTKIWIVREVHKACIMETVKMITVKII